MKILFYAYSALWYEWHTCVLVDEAIKASKEGHKVFFLYNDCSLKICTGNLEQKKSLCAVCHERMQAALRLLPKDVVKINIADFWINNTHKFDYNSVADIKTLEYKEVKIGYSVLSSYITKTRNLYPEFNNETKYFFDYLLGITCNLTDAIEKVIEKIKPDKMCFFNSRFFEWRPPYDLAMARGIPAISYEKTYEINGEIGKVKFVNNTPHNIQNLQNVCDKLWEDAPLSEEQKIVIGKDFFERRRNALPAGDVVYTSKQQIGLLPNNWDNEKSNIVIFNSSEDEFAAIGDEYDKLALFRTQFQGIKFILESLKNNNAYHVYLRVHPNLGEVPYRYHSELMSFSKLYDNVTVIPAYDSISTYALMDAAEKVVVFGSTMGLESAYWGKSVILLAGAIYYISDICYVPKSTGELQELLTMELLPKNNKAAIKWGFYLMYQNPKSAFKYINAQKTRFSLGRYHWTEIPSLKLFGSSKFFAIYIHFVEKLYRHFDKPSPIPIKEDLNAEL